MKKLYILYIALFSLSGLAAQIDRSVQPSPGPAPEIQLDEPQSFTLKNGMTVMVVENHKLPRVSVTLNIDNPPIFEGDLAGANNLLGSMLGKGSTNIAKNDFEEEVDFMGASLSFGSSGAFAASLSRYFPRVLELMAVAALNPNFLNEEFEKEKGVRITWLENVKEKYGEEAYEEVVSSVLGKNGSLVIMRKFDTDFNEAVTNKYLMAPEKNSNGEEMSEEDKLIWEGANNRHAENFSEEHGGTLDYYEWSLYRTYVNKFLRSLFCFSNSCFKLEF